MELPYLILHFLLDGCVRARLVDQAHADLVDARRRLALPSVSEATFRKGRRAPHHEPARSALALIAGATTGSKRGTSRSIRVRHGIVS